MTLDAGGTNFRFSSTQRGVPVTETIAMPSNGNDLERCLANILDGFTRVKSECPAPPAAISFAFPGPADYPHGIIGDVANLPGFCVGGVALGPMLEDAFQIPVFINNDADLFTFGEAIAGLLPHVNGLLEKAGNPKRYQNLLGVTLGTGIGGGIVRNGQLFFGDNFSAAEIWLMRNKLPPQMNVEESACIRAVRRVYAVLAGIPFEQSPDPRCIEQIALGAAAGNVEAARESYRRLGEAVGDTIANVLTLVDGLVVIGGGVSKGWRLFWPALMEELNSHYTGADGSSYRRLTQTLFDLEDSTQLEQFLQSETREILVPGGSRTVKYDPSQRLAVGISRLGTSEAVAIGAYAFALRELDQQAAASPAVGHLSIS
ncbi:MAG: ROK family protein [Akkermansiaceae bacterium]